jgi:hypothetical protein
MHDSSQLRTKLFLRTKSVSLINAGCGQKINGKMRVVTKGNEKTKRTRLLFRTNLHELFVLSKLEIWWRLRRAAVTAVSRATVGGVAKMDEAG